MTPYSVLVSDTFQHPDGDLQGTVADTGQTWGAGSLNYTSPPIASHRVTSASGVARGAAIPNAISLAQFLSDFWVELDWIPTPNEGLNEKNIFVWLGEDSAVDQIWGIEGWVRGVPGKVNYVVGPVGAADLDINVTTADFNAQTRVVMQYFAGLGQTVLYVGGVYIGSYPTGPAPAASNTREFTIYTVNDPGSVALPSAGKVALGTGFHPDAQFTTVAYQMGLNAVLVPGLSADHYKYSLDGGAFSGNVSSPITATTPGVGVTHSFDVLALDSAGSASGMSTVSLTMPATIADVVFSSYGTSKNLSGNGPWVTDSGTSCKLNAAGNVIGLTGGVDSDCKDDGSLCLNLDTTRDFEIIWTVKNTTANAGGINTATDSVFLTLGTPGGTSMGVFLNFGTDSVSTSNQIGVQIQGTDTNLYPASPVVVNATGNTSHAVRMTYTKATRVSQVYVDGVIVTTAITPTQTSPLVAKKLFMQFSSSVGAGVPNATLVELVVSQNPPSGGGSGIGVGNVFYAPGLDPRMGDIRRRPGQVKAERESRR